MSGKLVFERQLSRCDVPPPHYRATTVAAGVYAFTAPQLCYSVSCYTSVTAANSPIWAGKASSVTGQWEGSSFWLYFIDGESGVYNSILRMASTPPYATTTIATSISTPESGFFCGLALSPAVPVVALLLRADSTGSLSALRDAIARIPSATDAVVPRVVSAAVGDVSEKDVAYAAETGAHLLAFGARVPAAVARAAERAKVQIRRGDVIYHVLDDICALLASHLPPVTEEDVLAVADTRSVFALNARRGATAAVAGCVVLEGTLTTKAARYRLVRDGATVFECAALASLQHFKDRVESVKKGSECGLSLEGWAGEYAVGDRIHAIAVRTVPQKLVIAWD